MKLSDIYKNAVEFGMEADPRGKKEVEAVLTAKKEEYNFLKDEEKEFFEKESLNNPYKDTRILHGDPKTEVKDIMVGIDMEGPELVLADRLKSSGKNVDLVIAHHPEGFALATFYEVMDMQSSILNKFGVPIAIAEDLLMARKEEVQRRVLPGNHTRSADIARVLDIPYMCTHTVADNHVVDFLQKGIDGIAPDKVQDIMDFLYEQPEYKIARKMSVGPKIIAGNKKRKCGKVFVDMTGGTEGPQEIFTSLSQNGVGTIVCMHLSEGHFEKAKKEHLNIIIAGHISSDSIGMNLMFDKMLKKDGSLNFIPVSGFNRIQR